MSVQILVGDLTECIIDGNKYGVLGKTGIEITITVGGKRNKENTLDVTTLGNRLKSEIVSAGFKGLTLIVTTLDFQRLTDIKNSGNAVLMIITDVSGVTYAGDLRITGNFSYNTSEGKIDLDAEGDFFEVIS